MFEGLFSPHLTLALFSRALGEPQPDRPLNVVSTGLVFDNGRHALDATRSKSSWRRRAAVAFTLGTSAVGAAGRFYHESAAAAGGSAARGTARRRLRENVPDDPLPPGVLLVDRAPHQPLFPRASAVAHQGGAGTMGRAGARTSHDHRAARHDQPHNASRAARLGASRTIYPLRYEAQRVARELDQVLHGHDAERAAEAAEVVRRENGAEAAAAAIDRSLVETRRRPARARSVRRADRPQAKHRSERISDAAGSRPPASTATHAALSRASRPTHERRRARVARTVCSQHAGLELRHRLSTTRPRGSMTARDAGVRRAQQIAARFGRAHARDLQMLMRRDRVAEPRVVRSCSRAAWRRADNAAAPRRTRLRSRS